MVQMKKVSLHMNDELYKRLKSVTDKKNVAMSCFIRNVLKERFHNVQSEGQFVFGQID